MKLIFENWRRFKEALEYDSANAGGPAQDLPSYLKHLSSLIKKVQELDIEVMRAYEQGDPSADNLNAEFAEKQHELENILSAQEGEELTGGEESQYTTMDLNDLMIELASAYRNNIHGEYENQKEFLERIRDIARNYGWEHGGFEENTSKDTLLDAAKDAFDIKTHLRNRPKKNTESDIW